MSHQGRRAVKARSNGSKGSDQITDVGSFLLLYEPSHLSLSRNNESTRYRGKQVRGRGYCLRAFTGLDTSDCGGGNFNANKKAPPGGRHVNGNVSRSNRAEDNA